MLINLYRILLHASFYLVFAALTIAVNEDFIDTETEPDEEASLKCDACLIVAEKFGQSFAAAQISANRQSLSEEEIIEAAEVACDDPWEGYGVKVVEGISRLSGPGADKSVIAAKGVLDVDSTVWPRRLQDMCDELLSESTDERTIFNMWSSDSEDLHTHLCKGDGSFGACSSDDWGPWPGDDYEDYEDNDFEYVHDEF